jgi:hypothetical protein
VNGTTNTAVNRIVARVNSAGAIDTTTRIDNAYNQGNIRGAATVDGTQFWLTGSSGGVRLATLATTGSTSIETTPASTRGINVFGGQLLATSGSGTTRNVFKVGTGTPTMTGQMATSLYANPAATSSPYGFAMVDHNPNVAGLDTMYVADDQASMNGGGISKWTFDGTTWTAGPIFNDGLGATVGARGVAAIVTGNNVTVIATSSDATLNRVLVYVDTFSATPPTGTVVATAAANTIFRGVAPAPQ